MRRSRGDLRPAGRGLAHPWLGAWLLVLVAWVSASCGGGGVGSGGTGAPVADGLVTGFGSVIVDGIRYDDAQATVVFEAADGTSTRGVMALGHHVEMHLSDVAVGGRSVAQAITIRPDLVGRIDALGAASLQLLGQTVQINTDATAGPVTQFGTGLGGPSGLQVGAAVSVHGVSSQDSQGRRVLLAARIDPVATLSTVKLSGLVEEVQRQRMRVGQAWILVPSDRTVPSVGRFVSVRAAAASWNASTSTLDAGGVVERERQASSSESVLGGTLSHWEASASSFELQGVRVNYARAAIEGGKLASGRYVRVRGQYVSATDFVATQVQLRSGETEIELHGTVLGWNSQTATFTIRGQRVDASGLSDSARACLAEQRYVEVEGRGSSQGVVATRVSCSSSGSSGGGDSQTSAPVGAVIEAVGRVSGLDRTARQFVLLRASGLPPLTVSWSDRTEIEVRGGRLEDGLSVRVEGDVTDGGTVRARDIQDPDDD